MYEIIRKLAFLILLVILESISMWFYLYCAYLDPTDPSVLRTKKIKSKRALDDEVYERLLMYCSDCNSYVQDHSKHCGYCNKCVDKFDHHCKWINNCVGGFNYKEFILLVVSMIFLSSYKISITIFYLKTDDYNLGMLLTSIIDPLIFFFSF